MTVEVLLFDLGGVLIEIDFGRAFEHWERISPLSATQMKSAFSFDEPYARHERGEIEADEYFSHLREKLNLQASDAEIAAGWNTIFITEIPETLAAIEELNTSIPCYAFTNTNATHQIAWSTQFPAVPPLFERVFCSCEMGLRKPERRAFAAIASEIGVPLESILFFDDTLENVEGAAKAGLRSVHVRSAADVRKALAEHVRFDSLDTR